MGFLTGSYFKMMASRMKLDLQHKLLSAQSRLNRVTKEIARMEKSLSSQQRSCELALRGQMQNSIFGFANQYGINMGNPNSIGNFMNGSGNVSVTGDDGVTRDMSRSEFMNAFSTFQQQAQFQYAQAQSIWGNYFEDYREAMLEPMKNMETQLNTDIESIKLRLNVIEAQEKTGEQMAQSGVKDIIPNNQG